MKFFQPIRNITSKVISLNIDDIAYDLSVRIEFKDLVIQINTFGQLFEGLNSKGERLWDTVRPYALETIRRKERDPRNLPTDEVTLFQNGDFYDSFKVEPFKGGFNIDADGRKDDTDLIQEWGEDILGIREENLQDLVQYYLNNIDVQIKKKIGIL